MIKICFSVADSYECLWCCLHKISAFSRPNRKYFEKFQPMELKVYTLHIQQPVSRFSCGVSHTSDEAARGLGTDVRPRPNNNNNNNNNFICTL